MPQSHEMAQLLPFYVYYTKGSDRVKFHDSEK